MVKSTMMRVTLLDSWCTCTSCALRVICVCTLGHMSKWIPGPDTHRLYDDQAELNRTVTSPLIHYSYLLASAIQHCILDHNIDIDIASSIASYASCISFLYSLIPSLNHGQSLATVRGRTEAWHEASEARCQIINHQQERSITAHRGGKVR